MPPLPKRSRAIVIAAALPLALLATAGAPGGHSGSLATQARADTAGGGMLLAASPTATTPLTQTPPAKPGGQLYRVVGCASRGGPYRGGPSVRKVAIGFDDGPAPDTGAFVTMLERERATATFFMIGRQVSSGYREVILRELRNGDVPGDHTFTHPNLTAVRDVRGELESTLGAIRTVSGYTPCIFRPPYGDYDASVVSTARSLGLATVLWNVDPRDWARPGVRSIVDTVLAEVRPGSIIISHDGGGPRGQTLAAYPLIIAALRARHYRIVSIPELLGFRPVYEPCIKLCDGIGVPRQKLPRGAILQAAPGP
jgi:peptidoglycan/xylan/chitin deacetylase (PgdA/CDA1 family)